MKKSIIGMIVLAAPNPGLAQKSSLQVEVFKGKTATVNSYLFNNGKSIVVMDVLRSSEEAKKLAAFIKLKMIPLTHILVSHGHPDHYTGMNILHKEFPDARIVVATLEIKKDIKAFSTWMESVGWLEKEPDLKPKTADRPNGFDYDNLISVLDAKVLTLDGGGTLELETDYPPAESDHSTTVYSKDLNAFFSSDFCYNGVHLWLGTGVDNSHIAHWKDQLQKFRAKYGKLKPAVYPGHGEKSDISLFQADEKYIADFEKVTSGTKSRVDAISKMKALYPSWQESDFLLLNSVNFHVKE